MWMFYTWLQHHDPVEGHTLKGVYHKLTQVVEAIPLKNKEIILNKMILLRTSFFVWRSFFNMLSMKDN